MAVDGKGNAVAIWGKDTIAIEAPSKDTRYQTSYLSYGGSWTPLADMTPGDDIGFSPDIAFDGSGKAIAVWNTSTAIQAAMLPPGGTWSAPANIATSQADYGLGTIPKISVDATGYAVVNWVTESGSFQVVTWTPDTPAGK